MVKVALAAALGFAALLLPAEAGIGRESCHAWMDVNTNLFANNVRALRKIVGDKTEICAIMKANAYGCGIRTLMPEVINTGLTCIGIAGNDDAAAARESGFAGRLVRVRMATLHVPEARLDMCRPGSVFYMDYDPDFPCFRTIFSFKTRVAAVPAYPKGSTACYDRTYELKRDSRLANLPVGYADGYLRSFGNKGHVLIRGHRVPIVGVISMNTCLADVTDFPDVVSGDEVVLFGKQGDEEITAKEIEETGGMPIYAFSLLWGKLNPSYAF